MLISYALSNFSECMTSFLEVLGMKRHIGSQLSPLFTYLLHIYSVLLSICTMSTLLLLSSSFKLTHHVLFSVIHVCESYIILFVHFCVRNVQRHFLKCFSQKRHFRSQRFGMHHIFFVWRYVWSVTWELTNNCAECSMSFCMCSILKMHRDLKLEFHLSNYPFIHLLESHFYYSLLIMHHQFVLSAQRHFVYIIYYMLLAPIGAEVTIMASWRAEELCGLDAHASPAHPGAVTRFCGCIFIPSVLNVPHLFHVALCLKWHMRLQNPPVFKGGDCHINVFRYSNCYIVNGNPVLFACRYYG